MSLLFDHSTTVQSSFTVKRDALRGGIDVVLVGTSLWKSIASPDLARLFVSIRPSQETREYAGHPLRAISCWAVLDEDTDALAIPPTWPKLYRHIFSRDSADGASFVTVIPTEPILLSEVIVAALSKDAYRAAHDHISFLEMWLSDQHSILRHGSIFTFYPPHSVNSHEDYGPRKPFFYRLEMLEPVLQGNVQRDVTTFVITLSDGQKEDTRVSEIMFADDMEEEVDRDGIEINEGFLGNSLMAPMFNYPPEKQNGTLSNFTVISDTASTNAQEGYFQAKPSFTPVSISDDYSTLYLRTADLGRLGALNGDWVIACSRFAATYRLVRISANDNLVAEVGTVMGSPVLLHNIHCEFPESSTQGLRYISLRSSPFGFRQPAIPTARAVTIARIASPLSTNRIYQTVFLNALKVYFEHSKRIIKLGDIIVVPLNTDDIRPMDESSARDSADLNDAVTYPASPLRLNELVYFVITNIEHDVVSNSMDPSSDIYTGSTAGELGCWVDSASTRIIQTGVEHSRIPNVGTYANVDPGSPSALFTTLSNRPTTHLLSSESPFAKLLSLTSATLARSSVNYKLDLSILLKGARGIGKYTVASWVGQSLGMHLLEINCYDIIKENDTQTEGTLRSRFETAGSCTPCILILRHIEALALATQEADKGKENILANVLQECIRDMQQNWNITGYPLLVLGTTSQPERVPAGIISCFKHEIAFEAPNEVERREILHCLLVSTALAPDVSLSSLATQTAALVASDLVDLVVRAKSAALRRTIRITNGKSTQSMLAGIPLTAEDFESAIGVARASYSESIGAPKIPTVSWDDVGGLAHVKTDILDTIQLPLDHPELFADGLKKRSGILLYGPPGTGKTLLAKAVATSCSLNFFSVKGPELLNMYIGESEANVRRVFQRARDAKPCVIFFDELDSVAPKRGNHGDSGGVMDRIVSQLLAELDGMSGGQGGVDVFVIGATNRPDLLDPALLRPGRFDRLLYLGVSETHQAQLNILEALTRKFRLHPDLDLQKLAEKCPFNYTGADFYALCSDAMLNAMSRKAEALEAKLAVMNEVQDRPNHPHPLTPQYFLAEMATAEDMDVLVSQVDFDRALSHLIPSVSQSDMDHYAHIQRRFSREFSHGEDEQKM